MDAEEFYNQHLPIIGQIASSVCRRNGLNEHDAEDFTSDIRLKLCDDDYAVIRKFQGKSNFTTYLTVVINKAFVDHRRRVWGKWSPSSQAKRFGDTMVALETLVYRDNYSFDSACTILEQKRGATMDRRALRSMLAQLPRGSPRRFESDDGLATLPSHDGAADARVLDDEREQRLAAAETALRNAVDALADEDRAVIRLLYNEGLSVAAIARGLQIEQKRLYPRIKQLLVSLRRTLKSQGIAADVLEHLDPG